MTEVLGVPVAELSGSQVGLLFGYAALLWLPGLALGAVLGLRSWVLAALAPLLTYGLVTVGAAWMSRAGIDWTPTTASVLLLVALAVGGLLRWPLHRWTTATARSGQHEPLPRWAPRGHAAVALAVVAAAVFGGNVLLVAFDGLGSIHQGWDVMLHANGIRHIADTGAGGVYGMYDVNTYGGGEGYYPNAYHLIGALGFELGGMSIPAVLNAHNLLLPLMLALSFVALVRSFRGRVALAAFAALVSPMATALPYDLLWRGPLYPFATGLVLCFGVLVALRGYLDRPSMLAAIVLMLSAAGLLGLHSSMVFTALLFAIPMLVHRWWGRRFRRLGAEFGLLAIPAAVCGLLVIPHLAGALSSADSVLAFSWPQPMRPARALGEVFGFSTMHPFPQYWLAVFLVVGAVAFRSLGQLRWLPAAGIVCAALYVLSAAYDTEWAQLLTSVWWNDKWRLAGVAAMALLPVVAHGLTVTYDVVLGRLLLPALSRLRQPGPRRPAWAAAVSMAAVLCAFVVLSNGGYAERNIARASQNYAPGDTVSAAERQAFQVLDQLVQPGQRVMNGRYDGSGWMYALTGVRPVAAHFGKGDVGDAPELLARAFDQYDTNPAVRAAAARLNVRWVMVSPGFVRSWKERQPGLDQLEQVDALRLVYEQDGARIYKLARPVAPTGSESTSAVRSSKASG